MDNELWAHPDWARQDGLQENDDEDNDRGPSLNYIDMDVINDWVVKLTFERVINNQIECSTGSGFFLNLPNINQHVVLTAAHNLISNGIRTLNLKVIYNNSFQVNPNNPDKVIFADDKKPAIIEISVDNTDKSDNIHICRNYYMGTLWNYAVICIPRTSEGPRGFGFSLKLTHKKLFNGNVHVSGFKGTMMKTLRPFTCLASNMSYRKQCFGYQAKAEAGMSGSPVWVEYKGYPTVVAVHVDPNNHKSDHHSGALLTVDLLRDVFEWLNSGFLLKGVQIQVRQYELLKHEHPAADYGLFLSFMSNTGFGRIRQHSGTKFDWILAEVSNRVYFALSVTGENKWLRFDVTAKKYQGVVLSETMDGKGCLFLNLADDDCAWVILAVGTGFVENGIEKKVKLRMQGTHIKTYDVERESSEVSLVPNLGCEGKAPFFKLNVS